MSTYRKIYEQHYGPIPKDDIGRSYEIHHIDGNHSNNQIENLLCVSIQEHYNIHLQQGDYNAASMIARRMHYELSSEELSHIARLSVLKQKAENKHNLSNPELRKIYIKKQIENRTHPFFNRELQSKKGKKGAGASRNMRTSRFTANNPNNTLKTCEYCGKTTTAPMIGKWHGAKCKSLTHSDSSNSPPIVIDLT